MSNIHLFLLISKLLVLLKYLKFISFSPVRPQRSRNISSGPGCPSLLLTVLIDLRLAFTHFTAIIIVKWFWEAQPRLHPISSSPPNSCYEFHHITWTAVAISRNSTLANHLHSVLKSMLQHIGCVSLWTCASDIVTLLSPLSNKLLLHLWPTSPLSDLRPTMKWCNLLSV